MVGGFPYAVGPAVGPRGVADARRLFRAYAAGLPFDLDFQGLEAELAKLPGRYAPPRGALLLAHHPRDGAVGCVAVRPLAGEAEACEMKRLYVAPAHRRHGVGQALAAAVLDAARACGYARMRLDTVAAMRPARALYARLGFEETPPYYPNPLPDVVYLARTL